jgi:hypothetical protein
VSIRAHGTCYCSHCISACTEINPYYSQCIPSTKPSIPTSVQVTSTSTTPGQGLPTCFGTLTYYPYTTTVQTTYTFTRTIGPPVAPRAADLEPRYSPPACTTTSVTAPYTQYSYAYSETDIYTYIPPFTRTPTPTPTPTPFDS